MSSEMNFNKHNGYGLMDKLQRWLLQYLSSDTSALVTVTVTSRLRWSSRNILCDERLY